tara:strand:+ start:364 stop:588 length:225 start_codon:yes stop_codon:yes gene_type:complete
MSIYLAYGMAIYCIASIYYLIRTRSVGTPFKDSLSPKQKKIKKESADIRRNIFYQGIAGAAVVLFFFQPFKKCI